MIRAISAKVVEKLLVWAIFIQGVPDKILVVDGYFAKYKFVQGVSEHTGFNVISRLRDDANLKYLYQRQKAKGRGRPKTYDCKVDTKNSDKRRFSKTDSIDDQIIYGPAWSISNG